MIKVIRKKIKNFRAWLDYNPPYYLSSKGWRLFKEEFAERAPIRFWLKYNFPKYTNPIIWRYNDIKNWIRYRTTDRYHIVNTGLEPGYYNIDTIMLNANFTLLKDFVECRQAWCSMALEGKNPRTWLEKNIPFYYYFFPFRSPEFGIKHFEWAATLDNPSLPIHERSESQACAAREVLALYYWWTKERPARKEIDIPSYDDQDLGIMACLDSDFNRNAEDYKAHAEAMEKNSALSDKWAEEDTEMLIRLMKIRSSLWT